MLHVNCPGCQQRLEFADDNAGEVVSCSGCGRRMRLPKRKADVRTPGKQEEDPEERTEERADDEEPPRVPRRQEPAADEDGEGEDSPPSKRRKKRKLGPVEARFAITQKALFQRGLLGGCICAAGLALVIWSIVAATGLKSIGEIIAMLFLFTGLGLAVIAGGAYLLVRMFQDRANKVLLSADGLTVFRCGRRAVYVWDDIVSQRQHITEHYYNDCYTHTTHVYTLECEDGEKLVFHDELRDVQELGEAVAAALTRRELPLALADYDDGRVVSFGKLAVSRKGLRYGDSLLPWRDVKGVRIHEGYISVSEKGRWFNWCKIAAADVPNLFVFLALVDEIKGVKGL